MTEWSWSENIAKLLTHPASADCLPWLAREVQAGRSQLWRCVTSAGVLYVITRLDHNPTEWVICYAQGRGLMEAMPEFAAVAQRKGWRIRAHLTNPAMTRLARRFGARVVETVVRL